MGSEGEVPFFPTAILKSGEEPGNEVDVSCIKGSIFEALTKLCLHT